MLGLGYLALGLGLGVKVVLLKAGHAHLHVDHPHALLCLLQLDEEIRQLVLGILGLGLGFVSYNVRSGPYNIQ